MTERNPPRIEDAPGLVWRRRRKGWVAQWSARTDLIRRGYGKGDEVKNITLCVIGETTVPAELAYISDRCIYFQTEMLAWSRRQDVPEAVPFDGTLRTLINCYRTDPDSQYQKGRYVTRRNYDNQLRRIEEDHGEAIIAELNARNFKRWHEQWMERGTATAHGLIGMLRTIFGFGVVFLEDPGCQKCQLLLHGMKFKMGGRRQERLTAEQATAIRAEAHRTGQPSIALAQAFQFECTFRQKDVIGEWVPQEERELSEVIDNRNGTKWLRGLRWNEIDANLILRHSTSKKGKAVEVNLRLAPMVMDELSATNLSKNITQNITGPVIVREKTGLPWTATAFRGAWRALARACGVPDSVWSMDSRAGAISEATTAGAALELVRHAATHSDIKTTQGYDRAQADATATVMVLRVKHRNKHGT